MTKNIYLPTELTKQYTERSGPYSKIRTEVQIKALDNLLEYNWQENWAFLSVVPEDTKKIQLEFYTQLLEKERDYGKTVVRNGRVIASLLYPSILAGDLHWSTGIHDYLDQILCLDGRQFGYTTLLFEQIQIEFPAGTLWTDFAPFAHVELRDVTSLTFVDIVFEIPFQFPARF